MIVDLKEAPGPRVDGIVPLEAVKPLSVCDTLTPVEERLAGALPSFSIV